MGMLKSWPGPLCQGRAVQGLMESSNWEEGEGDGGHPALTSAEDDALVGDLVLGLEAGAVPALVPELVLALVDGDLDALDGRGGDVRVAHAHLQLPPRQPGQGQADCVGIQHRLRWQLQAQDLIGAGAGRERETRELRASNAPTARFPFGRGWGGRTCGEAHMGRGDVPQPTLCPLPIEKAGNPLGTLTAQSGRDVPPARGLQSSPAMPAQPRHPGSLAQWQPNLALLPLEPSISWGCTPSERSPRDLPPWKHSAGSRMQTDPAHFPQRV